MFGSRFFWKIYTGTVAVILLTAVIIGVTVGQRLQNDILENLRQRLNEGATLVRELLVEGMAPDEHLAEMLPRLRESTGIRYTVVASDGTVLLDSDRDPSTLENHADRPEFREAAESGEGFAIRYSETLRKRMMYVARAVPPGSDVAWVRASVPLGDLESRLAEFRRNVALAVGAASVVALLFGLLVARAVTRPLVDMSQAARGIAAGDLSRRIHVESRDEVGGLARSFNLMAGQLQERLEALTEDRNKLQAVLGGMVEGVVAVDPEERVLHLNRAAARLLGADERTAVGRPLRSVSRVREVADAVREAIESGVDRRREIQLSSFPQELVLEIHSAPIASSGGAAGGAVVVLHDVTELRRLEAVRRDFVANVSHELKTPLTAVRGILETVLDDPAMPADTRTRFLRKVDEHSRRLVQIVTDLLSLTRAESRPEDLPRESMDLRVPLRESCRALEMAARDRGVALRTDVPDEEVRILGDRPSLRLVTDNLVDNALKYTPAGGEVTVSLRGNGRFAWLEVRDTGIGIAAEHHDRLFER
ncbi:MAG: HAMP domain-containing protein, partial [Gemmatimonadetes bacterium]|nr:HAMP domain-containing protein [Gemmatimonadota bacterium]